MNRIHWRDRQWQQREKQRERLRQRAQQIGIPAQVLLEAHWKSYNKAKRLAARLQYQVRAAA